MPRTRVRASNIEDISTITESEFNEFFQSVVITGTLAETTVIQSFAEFFPGQGLIQQAGNITVITGSNFVTISGAAGGTSALLEQDFTAGQNLTANDVVALDNSGDVIPALAASVDTVEAIGYTTSTVSTGQTATVRHQGNLSGFSSLTAGEPLFLSATTSGAITETPPSASGTYILQVGHTVSATEVYVNIDSASAIKNTTQTVTTLQDAYDSETGVIDVDVGKPVVISGTEADGQVDFKVVGSGIFTEALTIGENSIYITSNSVMGITAEANFQNIICSGSQVATIQYVDDAIGSSYYFCGVDVTGLIDVSSGWTDVTLDTEHVKSGFTHSAASAEVTIDNTGVYVITYHVGLWIDPVSIDRNTGEARLMLDTGGGYAEVNGTRGHIYLRDNADQASGKNSASVTVILSLTATDKIKLQSQRSQIATGTVKTAANSCGLSIRTI